MQCKLHENVQFMVNKLHDLKILHSRKLCDVVIAVNCNTTSKLCMYNECSNCKDKNIAAQDFSSLDEIQWWEWAVKEDMYVTKKDGQEQNFAKVKRYAKQKVCGNIQILVDSLNNILKSKFCRHVFNIDHQFAAINQLKEKLLNSEAIVHVDFAQNWVCKYGNEIAAVHFGASHSQSTLHTGVIYMNNSTTSTCTISNSNRHDPSSIWCFLHPVLKYIRNACPAINTIHFVSDGPSTQYRNKKNIYLLSTVPFTMGLSSVTWNFWEAGHGRGAPDGIGAVLKRTADTLVAQGTDLPDPRTLFDVMSLQNLAVKLFYVDESQISLYDELLHKNIPVIKGVMSIHQLFTSSTKEISHRVLSCFCKYPSSCNCFQPTLISTISYAMLNSAPKELPGVSRYIPGQWCIVNYHAISYAGKVIAVGNSDAEVSVLKCAGINKFAWPVPEDKIWYDFQKILRIIPEPILTTGRRQKLCFPAGVWEEISSFFSQ